MHRVSEPSVFTVADYPVAGLNGIAHMKKDPSNNMQFKADMGMVELRYENVITADDLMTDRRLLQEFSCQQKVDKVLMDLRDVQTVPSTMAFFQHGNHLAGSADLKRMKYAVIVSDSISEDAVFMETVAVNRGVNMRCFKSKNEAVEWLSSDS